MNDQGNEESESVYTASMESVEATSPETHIYVNVHTPMKQETAYLHTLHVDDVRKRNNLTTSVTLLD